MPFFGRWVNACRRLIGNMNIHKNIMTFLAAVSLFMQGGWAQSPYPPGTSPLETALADAGLFVLQLNLNGALSEFPAEDNPSGRLDDENPLRQLPPDSSVPYPLTLAFHFVAIDRSGMVPKVVAPNPTYHVRVYKESADAPWLLKEYWKISDGLRTDLPVPPLDAQFKADRALSKPPSLELPAPDATPPLRTNLAKIPCPRCKGEEGPMSTCPFCMKRGYIWVDAQSK